jgi:hypothetical protein
MGNHKGLPLRVNFDGDIKCGQCVGANPCGCPTISSAPDAQSPFSFPLPLLTMDYEPWTMNPSAFIPKKIRQFTTQNVSLHPDKKIPDCGNNFGTFLAGFSAPGSFS